MAFWPNRIKRLFGPRAKIRDENMYLLKINKGGHWVPTIVDDMIPILPPPDDEEQAESLEFTDIPFVMKPKIHSKGLKSVIRSKHQTGLAVDVWPQILAKGLAKAFLNYERMLMQDMRHFFRDLTGMPVRDYEISKVNFSLLRLCFKRQHMLVVRANPGLVSYAKSCCDLRECDDELLGTWIVNHALTLDNGDEYVEMVHPICLTKEPKGKIIRKILKCHLLFF